MTFLLFLVISMQFTFILEESESTEIKRKTPNKTYFPKPMETLWCRVKFVFLCIFKAEWLYIMCYFLICFSFLDRHFFSDM